MKYPIFAFLLFGAFTVQAQNLNLVRNCNIHSPNFWHNTFTEYDGRLYFAGSDSGGGAELMTSDGTNTGTYVVKDIYPGSTGSIPTGFTVCNGFLYFIANDSIHGRELWVTDGTTAGTNLVADINPGPAWGLSNATEDLFKFNGKLYFSSGGGSNILWVSDGTNAGTQIVKVIDSLNYGMGILTFFEFNNNFYFSASDTVHGQELWKSDGTTSGTTMLKDINPGSAWGHIGGLSTIYNGKFYFLAVDDVHDSEMWVSDGTAAGTNLFIDYIPGSIGGQLTPITVFNNLLFCVGWTNLSPSLLTSDGISSNLNLIKNRIELSDQITNTRTLELNGKLIFETSDSNGREPWVSDGTTAGTHILKDLFSGKYQSSNYPYQLLPHNSTPKDFTIFNNKLFMTASTNNNSRVLWMTDGTTAGTIKITSAQYPSFTTPPIFSSGSYPKSNLIVFKKKLYLAGDAPLQPNHKGLWCIDSAVVVTGVKNQVISSSLPLYPNPNNGIFTIEALENGDLTILNAIGQIVLYKPIKKGSQLINISGLSNGTYFAQTVSDNIVYTSKFILEN